MDDVTMPTLAEMERHATILVGPATSQLHVSAAASQLGSLGLVPVSPHIARITALEADVARLLAENVRLAGIIEGLGATENARLTAIINGSATQAPTPPSRPAFPARALARQHQAIGLTTEFS